MMSYACMHVHACVWVHVHVHMCGGTLSPPPTNIHPPPTPRGDTPGINQNSIALELIKIFQFRLKIWNLWRLLHPWVGVWFGGWVGGWVGWWVGSGQNTKNLKNVDWIKIIQFCLKIYHLWRHPHPWVGVWVVGWISGSMGGVKSNDLQLNKSWPNRDNSILFEDLWFAKTPQPMGGCVGGWVGKWVNGWG